jgi:hypothetical protein
VREEEARRFLSKSTVDETVTPLNFASGSGRTDESDEPAS